MFRTCLESVCAKLYEMIMYCKLLTYSPFPFPLFPTQAPCRDDLQHSKEYRSLHLTISKACFLFSCARSLEVHSWCWGLRLATAQVVCRVSFRVAGHIQGLLRKYFQAFCYGTLGCAVTFSDKLEVSEHPGFCVIMINQPLEISAAVTTQESLVECCLATLSTKKWMFGAN